MYLYGSNVIWNKRTSVSTYSMLSEWKKIGLGHLNDFLDACGMILTIPDWVCHQITVNSRYSARPFKTILILFV